MQKLNNSFPGCVGNGGSLEYQPLKSYDHPVQLPARQCALASKKPLKSLMNKAARKSSIKNNLF